MFCMYTTLWFDHSWSCAATTCLNNCVVYPLGLVLVRMWKSWWIDQTEATALGCTKNEYIMSGMFYRAIVLSEASLQFTVACNTWRFGIECDAVFWADGIVCHSSHVMKCWCLLAFQHFKWCRQFDCEHYVAVPINNWSCLQFLCSWQGPTWPL